MFFPSRRSLILHSYLLLAYPILGALGFTKTGTRTISEEELQNGGRKVVLRRVVSLNNATNRRAQPRVLDFLRSSTVLLEAHIKVSTPIPFCQFPNSPCT